jgi:hypothetical protein
MEWLKESSLRQQLKVPQNPKHHPEGGVDRHSMMVRHSLQNAIEILRQNQKQNPDGPLSNLDLSFSNEEINILRLAGLLHDIGKKDALDPETLSAHDHENPEVFEKGMQRLDSVWRRMYENSSQEDKDDLWWIIKYHMSLKDKEGFQNKNLKREMLDDQGKYKPLRRVKLLLTLLLMDRMGRGGNSEFPWSQAKSFAQNNKDAALKGLQGIYTTADLYKSEMEKIANRTSKSISNDPKEFADILKQKGKSPEEIIIALKGKFGLSDSEASELLYQIK